MVLAPYVSDANELTHSHDQSYKDDDDTAVHSQNQCISSMSDESYKNIKEAQMKPILFMGNPSFGIHSQVQHAYADLYLNAGYGSHPMMQPHLVQIAPARVPLPLDLSEDGPVYVNAKQYHGILRRRQIRAKLEAQNKLVKNRKPYLHESRHKHAVNRIRGSGGRFLPTKQTVKRLLSCSDSHSSGSGSGSGSESVMMNHGFSWG